MQKDIAKLVAKCQKQGKMNQDINIPTWKWDDLNMDLYTPHTLPP